MNQIDKLYRWYENEEHQQYIAPYFPLIQSSGMGKTKLLYEACLEYRNPARATRAFLLDCSAESSKTVGNLQILALTLKVTVSLKSIHDFLNGLISNVEEKKIVLFFDEAQHLIHDEHSPSE